jgi:hypothetical protein
MRSAAGDGIRIANCTTPVRFEQAYRSASLARTRGTSSFRLSRRLMARVRRTEGSRRRAPLSRSLAPGEHERVAARYLPRRLALAAACRTRVPRTDLDPLVARRPSLCRLETVAAPVTLQSDHVWRPARYSSGGYGELGSIGSVLTTERSDIAGLLSGRMRHCRHLLASARDRLPRSATIRACARPAQVVRLERGFAAYEPPPTHSVEIGLDLDLPPRHQRTRDHYRGQAADALTTPSECLGPLLNRVGSCRD